MTTTATEPTPLDAGLDAGLDASFDASVPPPQAHTEPAIAEPTPTEHSVSEEPEPAHAPEPDAAALALELAQWHDRYTRLSAEFDNFRKRTQREKEALLTYGAEPMAKAMLPVADDLARSVQAARSTQNLNPLIEGLEMVHRKFLLVLEQQGIVPIEAVGKAFDSAEHEAIASLPGQPEQKGRVIEEVERGYRYRDRVLRYAKVITGE